MGLFGDDLPRSSADIARLDGDPTSLWGCADDLRALATDLGPAWTATHQLGLISGGTSWQGEGFDAFRTKVERNPRPTDVENAQTTMSSAAAGLETLASGLADCQSRIEWCRQRIDALGLGDGDIPDDVRPAVEAIKADADQARTDYDGHLRDAGATFDELTSNVVYADPPGLFGLVTRAFGQVIELNVEFAIGIVEGVWEMVQGVYSIGALLVQPHKWDDVLRTLDQIIQYGIQDPVGFLKAVGQAVVDWDTMMSNPARWAGKLVPAIILAVVTGGAGAVAAGAGRIAVVAARMSRLSRLATKLDNVAGTARRVDRAVNLADRSGLTRVVDQSRTAALDTARRLLPSGSSTPSRTPSPPTPTPTTTSLSTPGADLDPGPDLDTDTDLDTGTGTTPASTDTPATADTPDTDLPSPTDPIDTDSSSTTPTGDTVDTGGPHSDTDPHVDTADTDPHVDTGDPRSDVDTPVDTGDTGGTEPHVDTGDPHSDVEAPVDTTAGDSNTPTGGGDHDGGTAGDGQPHDGTGTSDVRDPSCETQGVETSAVGGDTSGGLDTHGPNGSHDVHGTGDMQGTNGSHDVHGAGDTQGSGDPHGTGETDGSGDTQGTGDVQGTGDTPGDGRGGDELGAAEGATVAPAAAVARHAVPGDREAPADNPRPRRDDPAWPDGSPPGEHEARTQAMAGRATRDHLTGLHAPGRSPAELELVQREVTDLAPLPAWKKGNNDSYLVELADGTRAIYKPIRGENPEAWTNLHTDGYQAEREVAMSRLDEELGYGLVPTTTWWDGPFGPGSLQEWAGDSTGYMTRESYDEVDREHLAVLDHIAGNEDRRPENVRTNPGAELLAIDNGLSFPDRELDTTAMRKFAFMRPRDELSADTLERLAALDVDRLRRRLTDAGLTDRAVGDALARLQELIDTERLPEIPVQRLTIEP